MSVYNSRPEFVKWQVINDCASPDKLVEILSGLISWHETTLREAVTRFNIVENKLTNLGLPYECQDEFLGKHLGKARFSFEFAIAQSEKIIKVLQKFVGNNLSNKESWSLVQDMRVSEVRLIIKESGYIDASLDNGISSMLVALGSKYYDLY